MAQHLHRPFNCGVRRQRARLVVLVVLADHKGEVVDDGSGHLLADAGREGEGKDALVVRGPLDLLAYRRPVRVHSGDGGGGCPDRSDRSTPTPNRWVSVEKLLLVLLFYQHF